MITFFSKKSDWFNHVGILSHFGRFSIHKDTTFFSTQTCISVFKQTDSGTSWMLNKSIKSFVFRHEGWPEDNIPWWRRPRTRTGTRRYYHCFRSEGPRCFYSVRTFMNYSNWPLAYFFSNELFITLKTFLGNTVEKYSRRELGYIWCLF